MKTFGIPLLLLLAIAVACGGSDPTPTPTPVEPFSAEVIVLPVAVPIATEEPPDTPTSTVAAISRARSIPILTLRAPSPEAITDPNAPSLATPTSTPTVDEERPSRPVVTFTPTVTPGFDVTVPVTPEGTPDLTTTPEVSPAEVPDGVEAPASGTPTTEPDTAVTPSPTAAPEEIEGPLTPTPPTTPSAEETPTVSATPTATTTSPFVDGPTPVPTFPPAIQPTNPSPTDTPIPVGPLIQPEWKLNLNLTWEPRDVIGLGSLHVGVDDRCPDSVGCQSAAIDPASRLFAKPNEVDAFQVYMCNPPINKFNCDDEVLLSHSFLSPAEVQRWVVELSYPNQLEVRFSWAKEEVAGPSDLDLRIVDSEVDPKIRTGG